MIIKNPRKVPYVSRNPDATRKRILESAVKEFSEKGFGGGRVEGIESEAFECRRRT